MLIDGDRLKVVNAPIARTKLGSATGQDVTFLQIALAAEVAARTAGDAALSAAIAAEAAARAAADATLAADIATETAARIAADNALSAAIAAETAARIAADAALAASIVRGMVALGNGVESGSVAGLGLAYVPSAVTVTVIVPANGLMIFATVQGNPTADGFDFLLSGITDSANYKLSYILAS